MSQEHVDVNRSYLSAVLWSVPAVLLAAAAYEVTLLLDLWGSYDGSTKDGFVEAEETIAGVAYLTMLAGSVFAVLHAFIPRAPWTVAMFAPAAAAFMTTRFYTYDPYFLPGTLRRYSDDGAIGDDRIFEMLAAALAVGVLTRLLPRVGSIATAVMLCLLLMTSLLASAGH
jgi:hypothetical protein